MSSALKKKAIDKAKEVRQHYGQAGQLKKIFESIFKDKNISLKYDEEGELTQYTPETDAWVITLPLDTSGARDNFTIAHELGHIFLEHELENNTIARSGRTTPQEVAANSFAAEFLMPEDIFMREAQQSNNNEKVLAAKFGVSPAAALVRLSSLKLI